MFRRARDWVVTRGERFERWGTRLLRRPGLRTAWLVLGCVVAVPALGFGTVNVVSLLAHEERTEVRTVDADGVAVLDVHNGAGSVEVVGVEGADEVTVRARISEGLRATGHRVEVEGDRLEVRGSCPLVGGDWCEVDYTIEVPTRLRRGVGPGGRSPCPTSRAGSWPRPTSPRSRSPRWPASWSSTATRAGSRGATCGPPGWRRRPTRAASNRVRHLPRVDVDADQGRIDIVLPDDPDVAYATELDADQGTISDRIRQDPTSDRTIRASSDQGTSRSPTDDVGTPAPTGPRPDALRHAGRRRPGRGPPAARPAATGTAGWG